MCSFLVHVSPIFRDCWRPIERQKFGRVTVEEANRPADLANKMMQDFKRQIAEKLRK